MRLIGVKLLKVELNPSIARRDVTGFGASCADCEKQSEHQGSHYFSDRHQKRKPALTPYVRGRPYVASCDR